MSRPEPSVSCDPLFSLSGSVLAIQSGGKFPGDLTKPCLGRQCDDCYNMLTKTQGRFAAIVEALAHEQGVTVGSPGKKGFGSSALQVDGKIFAMVSSRGSFVVKLPKHRVESLEAAGAGQRNQMRRSCPFLKWITSVRPVTREQFGDLTSCTRFPQRQQYSEAPADSCRLWPPS
jgi:hypothetical protein